MVTTIILPVSIVYFENLQNRLPSTYSPGWLTTVESVFDLENLQIIYLQPPVRGIKVFDTD
jgi:hypothetical protein